jgi:hypothetical protein
VDTFYKEAMQEKKEIEAKPRYSPEEVDRIKQAFQTRIWTLMDSLKMKIGDRDAFVKTVAREAIPIMESGKVNTDTVNIDVGICHFIVFMHKGKIVAEVKKDRTATEIHSQVRETTITPALDCPPAKKWLKFRETWIAFAVIAVLLLTIYAFVRSALIKR